MADIVEDHGDHLIVSRERSKANIPLSAIKQLQRHSRLVGSEIVLFLDQPSIMGSEIHFYAPDKRKDPGIDEALSALVQRIEASANGSPFAEVLSTTRLNPGSARPSSVIAAERLIWLAVAVSICFTAATCVGILPFRMSVHAVTSNATAISVLALCAVKIRVRTNWARWLLLAFFVPSGFGLMLAMILAPQVLRVISTLYVVTALTLSAIQLAALVLLFMPASNLWFRKTVGAPVT